MQPWDGAIPKEGKPVISGDRLSIGNDPPTNGRLDAISEEELVFSGAKRPREPGLFLQFQNEPPALAKPDAVLMFGNEGELSVAGLEIRAGKAKCQTGFARALEMPVSSLQAIVFPGREAVAPAPADVLVFRNGDEMRGSLLAAASGEPLRWKAANGQVVVFQPARVAGIRLARDPEPRGDAATVELRNGDLLRGEFVGLDKKQLQLQHAQLGLISLERTWLASLYPNPEFDVATGGRDARAWVREARGVNPAWNDEARPPWARSDVLDGRYVFRGGGANAPVHHALVHTLERFELCFEVANARAGEASFNVVLEGREGGCSLTAQLISGKLYLSARRPKARTVGFSKISLGNKLPDPSASRRTVRIFADSKVGTADLFLDGVMIARVGEHPSERLPGFAQIALVYPRSHDASLQILSNLWIGPWSGELPRSGSDVGVPTVLSNGDVAAGAPAEMRAGHFLLESEIGPLELPIEKIQAVQFGGALVPERAAARVRLPDGCAINVDAFRWDGRELVAHSAALGDLRLPAGAISELIYHPAPVRPHAVAPSERAAVAPPLTGDQQ